MHVETSVIFFVVYRGLFKYYIGTYFKYFCRLDYSPEGQALNSRFELRKTGLTPPLN